jgi:hypothetical protein
VRLTIPGTWAWAPRTAMLTVDIDSGNIFPDVYVVNIDWPACQRNPRWGNQRKA